MTAEKISWSEIQTHNHRTSCWVVLHGKVYNLTAFMDDVSGPLNDYTTVPGPDLVCNSQHPGGVDILLDVAGELCTVAYVTYALTSTYTV